MKRLQLMDTRTGETGTLDHFFNKFTLIELGRYIKPCTAVEIASAKERLRQYEQVQRERGVVQ